MMLRFIVYFMATISFSCIALASEQTYIREYTYQASEADSKITARAIALQEIKRELLSELGTHVSALVKQQKSSDGNNLGTEEIETLSAGVTSVQMLDEKWNGSVYVLKAQIKADPESVLKTLNKMLDDEKNQKQISQLANDLSKVSGQNIQIKESLTQSKKETIAALVEISRLKKELEVKQSDVSRQALQAAYQQQTEKLILSEIFESALKNYHAGKYPEAFLLFQKVAEHGDASAQFNLGMMYVKGNGITLDMNQAVYWWQKAAEQGFANAQYNLGIMYADGYGVAQDAKHAMYWYQKSAKQGYAAAQASFGMMYAQGKVVTRDVQQARYWWQKAAEQGNADAQSNLGVLYESGDGVSRDVRQAVHWYKKAAEQGDAHAQYNLGVIYENGADVAPDVKQAVFWYRKSADQGYIDAQYNLGLLYAKGKEISRDEKQAAYWLKKAAAQGDANAREVLTVMKIR